MRDLTAEELALTPEWATHYMVDSAGDVLFESREYFEWLINGVLDGRDDNNALSIDVVKINRKPFDITQHGWSDVDVSFVSTNGYTINLDVNDCGINHGLYLNKNDIIAAAKCLKLTAEDLK